MFCSKCGNNNNNFNLWCTRCGQRLENTDDNTENIAEIKPECTTEIPIPVDVQKEKKPNKIKDYMVWSITMAVLGSIAFGIAAVIFSGLTQTELAAGSFEKAKNYSDRAKFFCLISLSIAIVKVLFIALFVIISVAMASMRLYIY